ncbi:hypothetical protein BDV24DRAFT_162566 [Aspergillus arachidicola]|uniref:Protein kinase domain-containing protein n=1 Tax=Aspergillus arachidicola TaxID=656916 RepID=A0A5N6YA36_9EURO|nr:hypothetical protein BDV24DRAFT_162566 [Aspergillus arachidicola]
MDTSQLEPDCSHNNPIKVTFYSSIIDEACSVKLVQRIATKTFDAIHRSLVFESWLKKRKVVVKIWEISRTSAGEQTLEIYENEKKALQVLSGSGFTPAVLFDGYYPQHAYHPEARILITEWRQGERLRTCWPKMSPDQKGMVREQLLQFFLLAMERGIFHDDLRHLRNTLRDAEANQLTILDFEMVGVRWALVFHYQWPPDEST